MFVALDLPAAVRLALATWRDGWAAGRDDLRPVASDALHVTLAFLGWRPERETERIAAVAFEAAAGPGPARLRPVGLAAVPPRRPRLFALDLEDRGGAVALQARVAGALAAERLYTPETRPFWPHVTLARVKSGRRAEALEAPPPPVGPFEAGEVTLYRSTLRPQGAVYEALARTRLGG